MTSQSAPTAARPSREWGLWILYYMPPASVVIRFSITVMPQIGFPPLPLGLLAGFLVLSLSVPAIAARYPVLIQPWLTLQTALVSVLILTPPLQDYHAVLFLPLVLVCTKYLRPRTSLAWLIVFCAAATASLMLAFGPAEGLSYLPSYLMGILFLGLYGRARRRAEEARAQSDALVAELQGANEKLRAFAAQAEEVAAAQERNRLARELHDAATQTVFSITLTAQAARMACDSDPARLPELLGRIQEAGADALAEMRGLVSELRPRSVAGDGLVPTLRQHLALRERRERLRTVLSIEGEETGSVEEKETLLGVAQEALNNVVKHAGVSEAELALAFGAGEAVLRVRDAGRGFDPAAAAGGFGLASMRQRVQSRGGSWELASRPGGGRRSLCACRSRRGGSTMGKSQRTRVLIVDDHAVVRQGLRTFLGMLPDIQVVGEAASGVEALAAHESSRPDVTLMDLVMPDMDGVEATRRIRAARPDAKIIVLTSFAEEDKIFPAIRAGAAGYLLKDVKPAELADTIRAVARGESRLAPDVTRKLMSGIAGVPPGQPSAEALTGREAEVLGCLAGGLSNKEIAARLFIAEKTVKTHISNILAKLGCADRTQAAVYAVKHGYK